MRDMIIGPGLPCVWCGKDYGQHTKQCSEGKRIQEQRENRARELGKKVREAIEAKDDLALGNALLNLPIE